MNIDVKNINPISDYPLGEKRKEWLKTSTGKTLDEITLENVINGDIKPEDIRISPETLKLQGEIAKKGNRPTITKNFERASEMVAIPDDKILATYNALRPYRSSKEELFEIADELESKYSAVVISAFIKEAAEVYEQRGQLRKD
ncbi:diol dehydratase small subunit [Ilyobacter polytropus]|jgi:propanediol dehydratase small subunit|uniref:Glycerol dehydratase, cobalamin-dependent, gamma subunit n=1 Tax=Ilyobacter polytropus (strain ATCC 51220 / DSM 2926 / LMG 16218 / CuHBu1) TaxID=572544 RepID=E3H9G4_ILYPC|nr:diol dehydratase small subunit [Ilyobacter polytropus]ADO83073.1 glycerol dehydratase, cobalamin-dependent, gamma subunit [Ilyobacter polytropus DSM 2926]